MQSLSVKFKHCVVFFLIPQVTNYLAEQWETII